MAPKHESKTDALMRLARKGPVRARDLDGVGIPQAYLQRLCDPGVLERADRGLYRFNQLKGSLVDYLESRRTEE